MRGPWWRYQNDEEEKTRRCFVIAWGNIVIEPSEKYRELRSVKFVIKTGRGAGREERHLVCVGYGENLCTVIMRAAEKGDIVLVCGTWTEKLKSHTKKGIRSTYECQVRFVLPLEYVGFIYELYALPDIQQRIAERENEDADIWESDD